MAFVLCKIVTTVAVAVPLALFMLAPNAKVANPQPVKKSKWHFVDWTAIAVVAANAARAAGLASLYVLGFTSTGPAAGSYAATWMSSIAIANGVGVVSGSWFAMAQSYAATASMCPPLAMGMGVTAVVYLAARHLQKKQQQKQQQQQQRELKWYQRSFTPKHASRHACGSTAMSTRHASINWFAVGWPAVLVVSQLGMVYAWHNLGLSANVLGRDDTDARMVL